MKRFVNVLNETLSQILEKDKRVYIFGESIVDPYGGAFKVTKGLSTRFPDRVFDTPISEAALAGFAGGMAMRGLRPVLEIMFGDFLTLCMDQLLNSITKFKMMYGGKVDVPLVIRTAMGGRRGYGPTHSQALEKLFLGIPNLKVVSPSNLHDVEAILNHLVLIESSPSLLVEYKLLYSERMWDDSFLANKGLSVTRTDQPLETVVLTPIGGIEPEVTVITYGGMTPMVVDLAERLRDSEEIGVEIVIPSQIAPVKYMPILDSLRKTRHGVIVEEGTKRNGWGAEVSCRIHEEIGASLSAHIVRVAAENQTIPSCKFLELEMLPGPDDIEKAILDLV